jgi:hypothetical protein
MIHLSATDDICLDGMKFIPRGQISPNARIKFMQFKYFCYSWDDSFIFMGRYLFVKVLKLSSGDFQRQKFSNNSNLH